MIDAKIAAFALAVLADVAITVPFFHLEANPVVTSMGPITFVWVKVAIVGVVVLWWFRWGRERKIGHYWIVLMTLFHLAIVGSNAMVVTGTL